MAEMKRINDETPVEKGTLADIIYYMMEFGKNTTEIMVWLESINKVNKDWETLFEYNSDFVHRYYFSASYPKLTKEFTDEQIENMKIDNEPMYEIYIGLQECTIYEVKPITEKKYDIVEVTLQKTMEVKVYFAVDDNNRDDVEYEVQNYVDNIDEDDWENSGWGSGDIDVVGQKYEVRNVTKSECEYDYNVINLDDLAEFDDDED